jgi:hypothetical protein
METSLETQPDCKRRLPTVHVGMVASRSPLWFFYVVRFATIKRYSRSFASVTAATHRQPVVGSSSSMISSEFLRWQFQFDKDATELAYSAISAGSPEECGCEPCLNFANSRELAYPVEFQSLLKQIGVPLDREVEIFHTHREPNGLHVYGGWYYFYGALQVGKDAFVRFDSTSGTYDLEQLSGTFSAGLTTHLAFIPDAFSEQNLVRIEFEAKIPWKIDAPEPS